jgi:ABC-type nitrate/sulfonate/bicarbonate transport system substrate-binding protein
MRSFGTICKLGLLVTITLAIVACGAAATPAPAGQAVQDRGVMRFTFAPDPVWDYLNDNGIREEMEIACDLRILAAPTWDEFGIYAGGHADVVSVASFEVPVLDQETGQHSVIFGKYNIDRSVVAVPADSDAQTLEDLKGAKIAVWDTVSSTMIWGILAEKLHGLDFRPDGGDFELVLADITNTAELAANHEVDGALILPDFSVPALIENRIRVIYDGRTAADMYSEVVGAPHEGPMINVFLARNDYYQTHPDEIACFMAIWERGIKEWQAHKEEIIASYPQHFAVESDDEIRFMQDYLVAHDWFVSSVYMDPTWVGNESEIFDLMRETGFMAQDQPNPEFDVIGP